MITSKKNLKCIWVDKSNNQIPNSKFQINFVTPLELWHELLDERELCAQKYRSKCNNFSIKNCVCWAERMKTNGTFPCTGLLLTQFTVSHLHTSASFSCESFLHWLCTLARVFKKYFSVPNNIESKFCFFFPWKSPN